jgi:AcrR family transcriptional regulator
MEQLPRGIHGLSREFVLENQRGRLITSVTACVHEHGYSKTTVEQIIVRARISKADFYKNFENKEEAFLAAYDAAVEQMREVVVSTCADREDWGQGVCAALAALLAHIAGEPAAANLVLVEGLSAGRGFHDRYQEAVRSFVPYLREGAPVAAGDGKHPEATDEAVVGGIASLLGRHILAGEVERLEEFFPEIAEFALTPYVGSDEARRIISAA